MEVRKFGKRWAVIECISSINMMDHTESYEEEVVFKGSLADCWAFIRLTLNGYMT